MTKDAQTAVILMAYGSPARPEDIPAYFADIRGGRPVRQEAMAELTERYRRIGGQLAPQRDHRGSALRARGRAGLPVFVGMKHWHPWIPDAVDAALADGADRISRSSWRPTLPHVGRRLPGPSRESSRRPHRAVFVAAWTPTSPTSSSSPNASGTGAHVVFTAHSLPERILEQNDPYSASSSRRPSSSPGAPGSNSWSFAFQSASETVSPGSGPDILEELERPALRPCPQGSRRFRRLRRQTTSRSSGTSTSRRAKRPPSSALELDRIDSLNDDPAFIEILAGLPPRAKPAYRAEG